MDKLSDIYNHRQSYLERNEVPTQSEIRKFMKPQLADVYFKSMSKPLRVLAGLEPPLKGGGENWQVPPEDILKGKQILKPAKREHLKSLSSQAIITYGEKARRAHIKLQNAACNKQLKEKEIEQRNKIRFLNDITQKQIRIHYEIKKNTSLQNTMQEFNQMYRTSLIELTSFLTTAAAKEVQKLKESLYEKKCEEYKILVKQQSLMLVKEYDDKLTKEKTRLKELFMKKVEKNHQEISARLHDINIEKHVAIEKLRQVLHTRNLACQVYVALKEREECKKEISMSKHEHKKTLKEMKQTILLQDYEIKLHEKNKLYLQKREDLWKMKVLLVVESFQLFVQHCLRQLPEAADFFINVEKLMVLQLNQATDEVTSNCFEIDEMVAPKAKPHPFYLFRDLGTQTSNSKLQIDDALCPIHCTSSASLLPVIVVNKRCIYSACDNFEVFTDIIRKHIYGRYDDGTDVEDVRDNGIPVTYTKSEQIKNLKLESSLVNMIQNEIINLKNVDPQCKICEFTECFIVTPRETTTPISTKSSTSDTSSISRRSLTKSQELFYHRGPKWESYIDYVLSRKCTCICPVTANKHLREHMPPYMIRTSKFEDTEILNYKKCPLKDRLAKRSVKVCPIKESKIDVATQYDKEILHKLQCSCFDRAETYVTDLEAKLARELGVSHLSKMNELFSTSTVLGFTTQTPSTFAANRIDSLRKLIGTSKETLHLFKTRRDYS